VKKAKKPKQNKEKKEKKEKSKPKTSRSTKASAKAGAATGSVATKTRGVAVPKTTTTSTSLSASSSKGSSSKGEGLVWVWQYYNNGFYNYDSTASDVVEGVYQEYLTSPYTCDVRAVQSGQWKYEIDFRTMIQTNIQHEDHTKRRIRRFQVPSSERLNRTKNYGGDANYNSESMARKAS